MLKKAAERQTKTACIVNADQRAVVIQYKVTLDAAAEKD